MLRGLLIGAMTILMAFPTFAQEDKVCFTPEDVHAAFMSIAEETGDDLVIVLTEQYEDGSSAVVYWKHGETVLVILFDTEGCFQTVRELTLPEFKAVTGIVLS